jgi:uncharacterized membrane protein HdeD (DUF308 family)
MKRIDVEEVFMTTESPFAIPGLPSRHWWLLLLRGITAMLFGILCFPLPMMTLAALVTLFGAYALLDGVLSLLSAITGWHSHEHRWLHALEGLAGLWAGLITLLLPGITAVALMFFIAIWALVTGIVKILEAMRDQLPGRFWLTLSGIVSVAFALLVMMRPLAGALALSWLIGSYAILMGGTLVVLGLKLRRIAPDSHTGATDSPHPKAA